MSCAFPLKSFSRPCELPTTVARRPPFLAYCRSMDIGIIGLPKAGKTTIFNALTGQEAEVAEYASARVEPNVAVVEVGDPRVDELARRYQPRKTVYATIQFIDFVTSP